MYNSFFPKKCPLKYECVYILIHPIGLQYAEIFCSFMSVKTFFIFWDMTLYSRRWLPKITHNWLPQLSVSELLSHIHTFDLAHLNCLQLTNCKSCFVKGSAASSFSGAGMSTRRHGGRRGGVHLDTDCNFWV